MVTSCICGLTRVRQPPLVCFRKILFHTIRTVCNYAKGLAEEGEEGSYAIALTTLEGCKFPLGVPQFTMTRAATVNASVTVVKRAFVGNRHSDRSAQTPKFLKAELTLSPIFLPIVTSIAGPTKAVASMRQVLALFLRV